MTDGYTIHFEAPSPDPDLTEISRDEARAVIEAEGLLGGENWLKTAVYYYRPEAINAHGEVDEYALPRLTHSYGLNNLMPAKAFAPMIPAPGPQWFLRDEAALEAPRPSTDNPHQDIIQQRMSQ